MKKTVALLLSGALVFGTMVSAAFSDVNSSHWAYTNINTLVEKRIINGYDDNTFKPGNTVTRAEWAKMLCSASGRSTENLYLHLALENCADLSKYHWAASYMVAVDDVLPSSLINHDTYYFPERAATREEVVASLAKLKNYTTSDPSVITQFSDYEEIQNMWDIAGAVAAGIVDGYDDGTFRPKGAVTRAEAAALLCRTFKFVDETPKNEYSKYIGNYSMTSDAGTRSESTLNLNIYSIDETGIDFNVTLIPPRHIITMTANKGYFTNKTTAEASGDYDIDGQKRAIKYYLVFNEDSIDLKYTLTDDSGEVWDYEYTRYYLSDKK